MLKASLLPEAVPLVTITFIGLARLAAPRAGASRGAGSRRRRAPREGRGRARGQRDLARLALLLHALGDDAARRAGRVDRDRPGLSISDPRAGQAGHVSDLQRSPPATRIASSELRSWRRWMSAPPRDRERRRGDRPRSRSAGAEALLPGAGEHGADEVLARERDVERPAQRLAARRGGAGSRGPPRCSGRSRGRGRSRSAPRRPPAPARARPAPRTSAFRCSTTSS